MTTKHVGWLDLPRDRILATALDVRCDYVLAKIVIKFNVDTQVSGPDLLDTAICEAESVGFRDANRLDVPTSGPTMPAYFADEQELAGAWNRGVERARRQEIRQQEWLGKNDLPIASELHALLEQGISCSVNGHYLKPDEQGVWITNPYGIDCGLWQNLTMQHVEKFLRDMEMDEEYGPVP